MKEQLAKAAVEAVQLLAPIVVGLIGAVLLYLTNYLKSKIKNKNIQDAADRLDEMAMGVVKEVQQAIVSNIQPGEEPAKAYADAKAAALTSLKSHYGEKGLDELKKVLGWDEIEKNLSSKIEEKVHDLKLLQVAALNPPIASAIAEVKNS